VECPAAGRCQQPSDSHQPTISVLGKQHIPASGVLN
jgi:hypothetical protein